MADIFIADRITRRRWIWECRELGIINIPAMDMEHNLKSHLRVSLLESRDS